MGYDDLDDFILGLRAKDTPVVPPVPVDGLVNGDCIEAMSKIATGSVDLVLTDPPYGTTACAWDSVIPFAPMWRQLKRVTKPNAAIILMASQPFTSALGASNLEMLRYSLLWEKTTPTGHLNAKRMPLKIYEDILVFYAEQPTYNPQGITECNKIARKGSNGACYGSSENEFVQLAENYPRSIIKIPRDSGGAHPTQKPVALMEYLIKTYSDEGETVLDFTMGSGTTGVACAQSGRRFIGIEKDANYYAIAKTRIQTAANLKARMNAILGRK